MTERSLTDLIHLEEIEATRLYRGDVSTNLQRAFGGQVLAESLLAAYESVADDRVAHSLHAYFLRPGQTTLPVLYDLESTREGRSFSSRRVIARQGGKNIFQCAVSFKEHEAGLEHGDRMPDVPGPDECEPLADVFARATGKAPMTFEQEWNVLDVRFVGDSRPKRGDMTADVHGAHMRVWVKVRGALPDKLRWHQAALAYLSDLTLLSVSAVPHDVPFGADGMLVASIDHAMWFHRPLRADQWLLYDQISPSAGEGMGFSFGRLFQDGRLVATCAQEGLIRIMDPSLLDG